MKIGFFLFLIGYFVLLLFVGFLFSKRIKNLEDFFFASRNLPAFLVFFSLSASWFGATSILVSTDRAFEIGLSSFWVMGAPAVLTVLLLAFVLSRPIRRLPIVSLPDLVELRYGRTVRHMSSFLIIWYMAVLAASQMVAAGIFLESFLGIPYFWSMALGTFVVLVYSAFGGFLSVVVTDGLQFVLLIAGIFGLFIFLSGSSSMNQLSVYASELGKRDYFNIFFNFKENILIVFSFTLAWTISPIAWQRIQAARSDTSARTGLFATSGTLFFLYWIVVFIGMLSLPLFFSRGTDGPLLSALISSKTGVLLGGILFVAVVAAVMSTMDTAINTGALSLTRDVYQQVFPQRQGKEIVFVSRLSTFIVGGVAFLVAIKFQSILKTLGLASEIMAEGLFVPGIAMVFLRKKLPLAGFLSLFLGGGYSIVGFLCELGLLPLSWPSWPYSVPYGLGLSLAGFVTGFVLERFVKKKK